MPIPELERRFIMEYGQQMRELYPDRDWVEVEPLLRQLWEANTRGFSAWDDAKDLMHTAWRAWRPAFVGDMRSSIADPVPPEHE